jgi:hypothetical protein
VLAAKGSYNQRYSLRVSTFQLTLVKIIYKIHLVIINRLRGIWGGGIEMKEWTERAPELLRDGRMDRGVVRLGKIR